MEPSQLPLRSGPGRSSSGERETGRGRSRPLVALAVLVAVIAGTAVLGAATGFLWASVAPRALAVVVAKGSANVVNPETSAFIAADGWFTLLTVIGGIISGLVGYALAVRRHGALAMAGVLAGALAATLIAMWIGQRSGTAAFNHDLAIDRPGTLLRVPLMLGGHGPLAFWPIAAGLTAGCIELIVGLRERRHRPAPLHAYGAPRYPDGRVVPDGQGAPDVQGAPDGRVVPDGQGVSDGRVVPDGQAVPDGRVVPDGQGVRDGQGAHDGLAGGNGTGPDAPPRLTGPAAPGQAPDPRD